jgi:hypothetical protein
LYSICLNDPRERKNIPFYDFVTTSHSTLSVTKNLLSLKDYLNNFMPASGLRFPRIVVVDYSWVLINSILGVFSDSSIKQYLDKTFEIFINGKNETKSEIPVRIYLCSFHFMKMIKRRIKLGKVGNEEQINLFVKCVGLLQNSKTLEEFQTHLQSCYIIFNRKKKDDQFRFLLTKAQNDISDKKLQDEKQYQYDQDQVEKSPTLPEGLSFQYSSIKNKIKEESRFNQYFNDLLSKFQNEEKNSNNKNGLFANEYYCPELFEIIKKYLFIMPLWTGLNLWDMEATRLTNNFVESWFRHLKRNLLMNEIQKPSQFVSALFDQVRALYFQFYLIYFEKKHLDGLYETVNENPGNKNQEQWKGQNKKSSSISISKINKVNQYVESMEINQAFMLKTVGLTNLGATCYFNSIIQSLARCKK